MAPRRRKLFAACLLIGGGMVGASQAAPVTVTGTFTSFASEMGTDRTSYVYSYDSRANVLQSNYLDELRPPTPLSNGFYQSQMITFQPGTTKIDFTYDPGCCGFTDPFPLKNTFELFPGAANVVPGQELTLATFAYTNGQWWPEADISFSLVSHSSDPDLDGHTFNGTLHLTSTVGTKYPPNPLEEADLFYVVGRPDLGSGRAYERFIQPKDNPGWTGYFAFDGHIGSLVLDEIVPLNTAAFTNASILPQLSGPSTFGTAAPIPEPETYAMMLAGLGLLGFAGRRRRHAAA